MQSPTITILAVAACVATMGIASAQTPPPTVDGYLGAAKIAAGTDWAGTFLRLCIPVPAGLPVAGAPAAGVGGRGAPRRSPARETWYAEPAKVADNLYFLGTKIHSAWAIVGSQGMIIIEALFDYAAKDEILAGLEKLGLDKGKVKYLILSHAHADHDGGAKLLQDEIPGVHLIYGAEDWEAVDKSTNHAGGKPKHDMVGGDGMKVSVGDASVQIVTMPGHTPGTLSCRGGPSSAGSSGGPAEEGRKNSLRVEREGNIWLRKAHVNEGNYPNIKKTVLAVEYCLVRSGGYCLQKARQTST